METAVAKERGQHQAAWHAGWRLRREKELTGRRSAAAGSQTTAAQKGRRRPGGEEEGEERVRRREGKDGRGGGREGRTCNQHISPFLLPAVALPNEPQLSSTCPLPSCPPLTWVTRVHTHNNPGRVSVIVFFLAMVRSVFLRKRIRATRK